MPFSNEGLYRKNIAINNWWASSRFPAPVPVRNINENENRFTFRKTIEMSLLAEGTIPNRIEQKQNYCCGAIGSDGRMNGWYGYTIITIIHDIVRHGWIDLRWWMKMVHPAGSHLFNMYWHTLTAGVSFITLSRNPVYGFGFRMGGKGNRYQLALGHRQY